MLIIAFLQSRVKTSLSSLQDECYSSIKSTHRDAQSRQHDHALIFPTSLVQPRRQRVQKSVENLGTPLSALGRLWASKPTSLSSCHICQVLSSHSHLSKRLRLPRTKNVPTRPSSLHDHRKPSTVSIRAEQLPHQFLHANRRNSPPPHPTLKSVLRVEMMVIGKKVLGLPVCLCGSGSPSPRYDRRALVGDYLQIYSP